MSKIQLPPCGMLIGVPVYVDRGDYVFQTTGPFYTSWVSEDHDMMWYLNKAVEDRQGNLIVLWDGGASKVQLKAKAELLDLEGIGIKVPDPDWENGKYLTPDELPEIAQYAESRDGAGFYKFVHEASQKGLYVYSIYTDANKEYTQKIVSEPMFLGYNAGEAFSFRPHTDFDAGKKSAFEYTLEMAAESFAASVKDYFSIRRANGWKTFLITSGSFNVDLEIAAGGNDVIPHMEGFAFANLNFGMALCRGIYKQCNLPLWGCYMAHEHYCYLPYHHPQRRQALDAAYYLAYLNGSKVSVQECGSWWQQSDHIPDTPMHQVPKWDAGDIGINNPHDYHHLVPEARKHYAELGYNSPVCREYRRSVADFYDFLLKNGTPEGQPEVNFAALKGRYDFCDSIFSPNLAIAAAYPVAEQNPFWLEGAPERGWDIFRNIVLPVNDSYGEYKNNHFMGTPYGLFDIASFNAPLSAEYLIKNYKALIFTGWHSAHEEDYALLKDYVRAGGFLFVSIPHFAKTIDRNYLSYPKENLIHGGDFSELCGVKVKGRGKRFFWSLMTKENGMGLGSKTWRTKFGIHFTHLGDLEITDQVDVWAVDDEQFQPVLLRHKYGKGEVLFLNSWEYPGSLGINDAPGAPLNSYGLIGEIYRYMANRARGTAYITDDGVNPGLNCRDVTYSYFPSTGKVYFQNCNFRKERTFFLHFGGQQYQITLAPHEFRVWDPAAR